MIVSPLRNSGSKQRKGWVFRREVRQRNLLLFLVLNKPLVLLAASGLLDPKPGIMHGIVRKPFGGSFE